MWLPLLKQLILSTVLVGAYFSAASDIQLIPNKAIYVTLNTSELYTLSVGNLSENCTHVIFQAHSQWEELRLSLDPVGSPGMSAMGRSVGVLRLLNASQQEAVSYLRHNTLNATHNTQITVVIAAWLYHQGDPLPGACSMEFPMAQDPNILLQDKHSQNGVRFQYANVGLSRQGGPVSNCENKTSQSQLTYDVYQYFLSERDRTEEHFVKSISNMMDLAQIPNIARKIKRIDHHDHTEVSFGGYRGQGVIYAVVVNQQAKGGVRRSAAYVTVHTYSCQEGECSPDIVEIVFASILGACGLFLAFFGHRFFKSMMFLFGHFALFIVFYILVTRYTTWSDTGTSASAFCMALTGGVLWLLLWIFCGFPVLSMLLPGLVFGYVMSSLAFNYTPLGVLTWWSSEFNYGMAFACGVLILPVLILAFTKVLSILSCTVVGSYLVLYAIDKSYLRGSVHQIVDISFNKATQPGYIQALATVPIQLTDIILLSSWVVVLIVSFAFQWKREEGRPQFPPCPWKERKHRRHRVQPPAAPVAGHSDDEEEPLLAAHRQLLPSAPPPYTERAHPDLVKINGEREVEPL